MAASINDALRDIIDRHGTALLDDRRRCENCIAEAGLTRPEVAGLVAALKDNVPKQLAKLPAGTLSAKGIASYAAQLSENSGLSEAVARRSVEAWAYALGLQVPATARPAEAKKAEPKKAEPKKAEPKPAEPQKKTGVVEFVIACIVVVGVAMVLAREPQLTTWQTIGAFGMLGAAITVIGKFLSSRKKRGA